MPPSVEDCCRAVLLAACCTGCNVFASLEDCDADEQCPQGFACNPTGHFCERDTSPLKLGVTFDLSGDVGNVGVDLRTGIDLAATVVNDAGGVLDRELEFVVLDDEGDVDLAAANVTTLIEQRVVAVIGPITSGQSRATASITAEARVPQVSPSAGSPCLSVAQPSRDRWFFRTISTMRTGSGAAIAAFARERPDGGPVCETMTLLHSDDETGAAFADAVGALFQALGGRIVGEITFPPGVVLDYEPQLSQLYQQAPDCALLAAFAETGAAIIRAHDELVPDDERWDRFTWLGTSALRTDRFLQLTRVEPLEPVPSRAEGMLGGDTDSTPDTTEYRLFRILYNEHFGFPLERDTPDLVANAYDAALLLALAVEQAGTTRDPVKVRDGLWEVSGTSSEHRVFGPTEYAPAVARLRRGDPIHYRGASSDLLLDDRGTVSNPTLIWTVREGRLELVHAYDESKIAEINATVPEPTRFAFCD